LKKCPELVSPAMSRPSIRGRRPGGGFSQPGRPKQEGLDGPSPSLFWHFWQFWQVSQMSITVVTSIGSASVRSGLAGAFLERARRYLPSEARLVVYASEPLVEHGWMPPGYVRFKAIYAEFCAHFTGIAAHVADPESVTPASFYDYRFDATRFAIKAYALMDAANTHRVGPIIWLDSDVLIEKPVPFEFLMELAEMDLVYLDREEFGPECGFVLYNRKVGRDFIREFHEMYESSRVFDLPEWHDSYVFGHLLKGVYGGAKRNLARGIPGKHPWPQTVLGPYMTHLKGPARKFHKKDMTDQEVQAVGPVPLGDIL